MMYVLLQVFFTLTFAQLSNSIIPLLPTYNPSTRCHDLVNNENLTFAICLQRASNKQHPFHLYTAPSFCSENYPPYGHLVDLSSLSSSSIEILFQSLTNLLNRKNSQIDLPEPNFLWVESSKTLDLTQNSSTNHFSCPNQCQPKNLSGKFYIVKARCQFNNDSKPCLTTRHTHWDRAPFICLSNQTIKQIPPAPIRIPPSYPNDTIVFYDSTPCVIVRTHTHEYTFCFRRQSCPHSQTSAFCTTRFHVNQICHKEKSGSSLLTIENDDEYQLINDVVSRYSNETLLNSNGIIINRYIVRAQWMWIDGIKGLNDMYQWNVSDGILTPIADKYWCDNMRNCSGEKGRERVVLNIVCQTSKKTHQVCLATRRQSEPGPFICKRTLRANEDPVSNYTLFKTATPITTTMPSSVIPVYEKSDTSIYYDEHHCLTVQTRSHLYTFCLRRQNCAPRKAYCSKWSHAQENCRILKNQAHLLTIDNEQERTLITDIAQNYSHETRLTFNGSSYRYYQLADFLWIDGIQQANNRTYLWKNPLEPIPEHLWCPKNKCNSIDRKRVMLNLLCKNNNSLICLGTRIEWKPAPYVCKRVRPKDQCPILFDKIRSIRWNEMLVVTVNRTIALIKCKHPEYNTEIKVQYKCDSQTNRWELIYENDNFTCPDYDIPPMAVSINVSQSAPTTTIRTSTPVSALSPTISSTIQVNDCSSSELSSIISRLPTQSRYIYRHNLTSYSSAYYDMKLSCYFNPLIEITYRCELLGKQWVYVYGNTNRFRSCYPLCSNTERKEVLNKYFTYNEQTKIRTKYLRTSKILRLRCFNTNDNRWRSITYQCGTMTITTDQWFKLHSCFQTTVSTTTAMMTTTRTLPNTSVMVSMFVTQLAPVCPPAVIPGSPCEYQTGQYIFDTNGCARKICPSTSQLCHTIRCPPDRRCRVIPCNSCIHTNYLQAVCEYQNEPSLCELEKRLVHLNDYESIKNWERQAMVLIQQHANKQRQRLKSSWSVLTVN